MPKSSDVAEAALFWALTHRFGLSGLITVRGVPIDPSEVRSTVFARQCCAIARRKEEPDVDSYDFPWLMPKVIATCAQLEAQRFGVDTPSPGVLVAIVRTARPRIGIYIGSHAGEESIVETTAENDPHPGITITPIANLENQLVSFYQIFKEE